MQRLLLLASALVVVALARPASSPAAAQDERFALLAERAQATCSDVPRKVLAFYYGWYATREFSGRPSHWDGHDAQARTLGNSTNYPRLGPYDSHDPEVVEQHCAWARAAGLDGLIASWWIPGDFHDRGMPLLLERAQEHGLSVSAYFETVPLRTREQAAAMVTWLLKRYGAHPAWLKVDGEPVLFVYARAVDEIGMDGWLWVTAEVDRRLAGGAILVGDTISPQAARIFDGVHTYNVTGVTAGRSPDGIRTWARDHYPYLNRVAGHRITCATVIPGYDDTQLGRPGERPTTDRHDGATYRVLWEEAIAANPDWVLVTSFNEWHEGSEIEPSDEHGDRELRATAPFAERFRALPPRERSAIGGDPANAARLAALRDAFEGRPIGVMPDGDSEGMWTLVAAGVPAVVLTHEQMIDPEVLTPERHPAVLYACDEVYRATVRETDDVLHSLQRYVAAGGVLVALSSGPMPFYYSRGAGAQEHWARLGFPLRVQWEQIPENLELELFVVDADALPGVPATFDFPLVDTRWRPLVASPDHEVVPWIGLRDQDGNTYGYGAGKVRRGEGWLVYAWCGLAHVEARESVLLGLWTEVAEVLRGR